MDKLISLSTWWQRPSEASVAIMPQSVLSFKDFQLRVTSWVLRLSELPGKRFAVYHQDAAEFLAIMLALWQLERTACVPGDTLVGSVAKLKPVVDGFVGQFDLPETIQVLHKSNAPIDWSVVPLAHIALEVYTSGSTGTPKAYQKTIMALDEELKALEVLMVPMIPEPKRIIATVSHHHLYGMTFRLLRPFAKTVPFDTYLTEYLEDIIIQAKKLESFSLVSSPAHLGRFNAELDWQHIKGKCLEVISSAAPLKQRDSELVAKALAAPVKEIYGSTETGAIAWRIQNQSGQEVLWEPLQHVNLSEGRDNTLVVRERASKQVFKLADIVAFDEYGRFSLQGRLDQVVKVEGKRFSMVELEQLLVNSPLVIEAKVTVLELQRVQVAALLVLSEEGIGVVSQQGKRALTQALKEYLKDYVEAVVLPRRWRFINALPYNRQGKLSKREVTNFFNELQPKSPEILAVERNDNQVSLKCYFPRSLLYFDGHFDAQGVLPGVVQVHWAQQFALQYFNIDGRFKQLEKLKFQSVLFPNQVADLSLTLDEVKLKLAFSYQSGERKCSSGVICYD